MRSWVCAFVLLLVIPLSARAADDCAAKQGELADAESGLRDCLTTGKSCDDAFKRRDAAETNVVGCPEALPGETKPAGTPTATPAPSSESEQIVHLKNGSVIRGTVSVGEDSVVVKTGNGILTVPKSEVLKVEFAEDAHSVPTATPLSVPSPTAFPEPRKFEPRRYRVELKAGAHDYGDEKLADFDGSTTGGTNLQDFGGPQYSVGFAALPIGRGGVLVGGAVEIGQYRGDSSEKTQYPSSSQEHAITVQNDYAAVSIRTQLLLSPRLFVEAGLGVGTLSGKVEDKIVRRDFSTGNTTNSSCGDEWSMTSTHGALGFGFRASEGVQLLLDLSIISARTKVASKEFCSANRKIGEGRTLDMGGTTLSAGIAYAFR